MQIVPVYAAVLAFMFVYLSFKTIKMRRKFQVAVGDKGHEPLLRAMRVHANFAEYVPFALLLLYLVEISGGAGWLVHSLGAALLIGRVSHAYGVGKVRENLKFRQAGMVLTFACLVISSGFLIWIRVFA